jgi:hypothetical protein
MTEESTRPQLFVYVVESPSAPDLYHGRSEGELVARAVRLDSIPSVTRTVINPVAFEAALRLGLVEAMKEMPGRIPVLHVSAHGSQEGIQLSSGDDLSWAAFEALLTPINESLGGSLVLCMSACNGYSACRMAMQKPDGPHPYLAMVGNFRTPTWSDTAVAYSAFYHLLSKGHGIRQAVESMKAASGNDQWIVETAEDSRRGYLEYISNLQPADAQQALEEETESAPPSPEAKALETRS